MIVGSLALMLTLGVLGIVYLPYRMTAQDHSMATVGGVPEGVDLEQEVAQVLHLWYCDTCGGHLEKLDQVVCPHCGSELGQQGGNT
jgi:ABC-type ATPase with predicted acetyltransferase domain